MIEAMQVEKDYGQQTSQQYISQGLKLSKIVLNACGGAGPG